MSDLQGLKKQADEAREKAEKAGQAAQKAADDYDDARVEAMDPKLVKKARKLGINPKNFENNTHLSEAVEINSKVQDIEVKEEESDEQ